MEDYSYIINEEVTTEKMRSIVRVMIPTLIRWAQTGQTDKTYGDMIHILGYTKWSKIGYPLGRIEDILARLRKESGKSDIPYLNALCKSADDGLPSDGFNYVFEGYDKMPLEAKQLLVEGINQQAVKYDNWGWVLNALGLQPAKALSEEEWEFISRPTYGSGGEGEEHKALKEYIKSNPQVIGLRNVTYAATEYPLPSGDRLDVFFILKNGSHVAIEVKPSTSPEQDVTRGIFQCVKYVATMKAIRMLEKQGYDIQAYLVTGAKISMLNQRIADELKVKNMTVTI